MSWKLPYASYNDDALATLANTGLVRRASKDVEAGKFAWQAQHENGGSILADGQIVQLNGGGIPAASCDCPAPGLCKHILGAVIWLRNQSENSPANPDTSATTAPDILSDILALDLAQVFKSLGIACVRAAAGLLAELQQKPQLTQQGNSLQIDLPELSLSVRFMAGAGFAGMVSETGTKMREAAHLAAILAIWQAQQHSIPWPAKLEVQTAPTGPRTLSEGEKLFIEQTESLMREFLALGLAHLSVANIQRLHMLNMSARAEGMPRLAAMLRNLGGTLDQLAKHSPSADIPQALAQLSRLYAWCEASRNASGKALQILLEGKRRHYQQQDEHLTLLPLGAWGWETPGGAHGLSLALWCCEREEILHAVQARANRLDTGFSISQAWQINTLWQGSGCAQQVCRGSLILHRARLDDEGKLALGSECEAQTLAPWNIDDPRLSSIGFSDWEKLQEHLADLHGLHGRRIDSVLLRPKSILPPQIDEVRQQYQIRLQDQEERSLSLSLPCDTRHANQLQVLDHYLSLPEPPIAILASVIPAAGRTRLQVVALLLQVEQQIRPLSLDFAPVPKAKSSPRIQRILHLLQSRRQRALMDSAPPSLVQRLSAPLFGVLESMASTGRMSFNENQLQIVAQQNRLAQACGIPILEDTLTAILAKGQLNATDLLHCHYILTRLTQLEST